ncbi:cyclodeaminase/cyclohydrolase family protein [Saccharopolyspora sp. NFXS83]|uniref:cyclodeaminase/cyclohydrolase family protein n=1 Tax=Saccharopolyspora sp. NFXS83 TaxID=2993560 RepID=UPI00224AB12F|nr:cyclodeaminase/cyclohydrolase family protein [Saccharopolyspora sp. NFXS83]MCX2733806.1 cyclodeaminase/cyclohydrolase family protein [Saccharopolyspora sp. NFXS83]
MRTDTIDSFLHDLAARVPAPGGGATSALHAAQGAALVAMVARYSDGARYAAHAAAITEIRDAADELRASALALAEQDAVAFGSVGAAYGLPKSNDDEKAARTRAITAALAEAGRVPARVIAVAAQVLDLAQGLRPIGNTNVIADIAAAADAARAAASTARVNIEINLAGITDVAIRAELGESLERAADVFPRADQVTSAVREHILR